MKEITIHDAESCRAHEQIFNARVSEALCAASFTAEAMAGGMLAWQGAGLTTAGPRP